MRDALINRDLEISGGAPVSFAPYLRFASLSTTCKKLYSPPRESTAHVGGVSQSRAVSTPLLTLLQQASRRASRSWSNLANPPEN